jgi:hypothetical protein
MNEEDLALETLLEVRHEEAIDLPEELLRRCFAVQQRHQFDDDDSRGASAQAMDRLIDEALGTASEGAAQ